jgi:hypothetical protein
MWGELYNMKCVFILSTTSVWNIVILRRMQENITINVLTLLPKVEYLLFLSGIMLEQDPGHMPQMHCSL